jgi:hypothetical protein
MVEKEAVLDGYDTVARVYTEERSRTDNEHKALSSLLNFLSPESRVLRRRLWWWRASSSTVDQPTPTDDWTGFFDKATRDSCLERPRGDAAVWRYDSDSIDGWVCRCYLRVPLTDSYSVGHTSDSHRRVYAGSPPWWSVTRIRGSPEVGRDECKLAGRRR